MSGRLYARTFEGLPQDEWEELHEHLNAVGAKAGAYAEKFGARDFGLAAGLLHDLGKAKRQFQDYMCRNGERVSHSAEGARFAEAHYAISCDKAIRAPIGRFIAAAVAGHHSGLPNGGMRYSERLEHAHDLKPWFNLPPLRLPAPLRGRVADPFALSFFIRMLFSALVDADRLVSEAADDRANHRPSQRSAPRNVIELKPTLDAYLASKFPLKTNATDLYKVRAEVLADCRAAAVLERGLFSLTVPTGGGKSLSSLAFAMDHAEKHGLDRVIYVIPFTSIIDQTADVFGEALNDSNSILEHHSAFDDEELEQELAGERLTKRRLAMQNWDRPIVVTTAVQFFESLFAADPKRCRKLHNITRSVIVLDEVQTLPVSLLRPCLAALKELARGYGSSIVFCTATQPVLSDRDFGGMTPPREALKAKSVREIIQPGRDLEKRLQRVKANFVGELTDDALVSALADVTQGLVVVNNRRHARDLYAKMQKDGVEGAFHLTTAMTASHRQHALAHIRAQLKDGRSVRLVSTSLIEAGVDISFQAVWRAIAGLDQIVQAAGRCNRNGELGTLGGTLTVFTPEAVEGHGMPRELKLNADTTTSVLGKGLDPLSSKAARDYFSELLWRRSGDNWSALDDVEVGEGDLRGIMRAIKEGAPRLSFPFADIATAFRLIKETMAPVIIPYTASQISGVSKEALDSLYHLPTAGAVAREVQRHIVQIPRNARQELIRAHSAHALKPDTYGEQFVLLDNRDLYTSDAGFNWDDPTYRDVLHF